MNIVVADAGPLIGLARVGQLSVLRLLYESILIPARVRDELHLSSQKPGAQVIAEALQSGWIRCIPIQAHRHVTILTGLVDAGEAEAIQLALEQKADLLLIDDSKGRKVAKAQGLRIIGSGAVLIAAKKAGFLDNVTPVLTALTRTGYRLSPALCQRIIELAGE